MSLNQSKILNGANDTHMITGLKSWNCYCYLDKKSNVIHYKQLMDQNDTNIPK